MKVLILIHCMMYFLTAISAQGLFTISPDNASSFNIPDFSLRKVIIPPLIILEPSEYTISFREGEAFELPCAATGIPEPTYTWSCNDRDFDPSGMDGRIAVQQGVGTLKFLNPLPFDAAFYQCSAKNQAGIAASRRINVRMAVLDDFPVARLRINTPEIGYHLMLECLPPRSFPNPRVYWTLQTSESPSVKIDYTDRVSQDPIGNLIFANVVAADYQNNATYVCVARNEVLGTFKQGKLNKIYPSGVTPVPHKITLAWQSPTRQFGLRGKSVTIKRIFYGNPTPRVMWKRVTPPGADMPENSYVASFGQELVFTNLQYEDEGAYECQGINDEGLVPVRRSFSLAVQSAPYWIEKPQSQDVEEGATVVFKCAGESKPPPRILWYFNNIPVTNIMKNPRIFISQNKVTFTNVTIKDPMVVQCNISNNHGYNFTNAYINVLTEPPIILKKPIIGQKAAEGQTIELLCDVQGSPKPFVVWTKGNEQLTGGRFSVMNNGNLKITDLSLVDAGVYTCTATNKLGKADATGSLIVRPSTETTAKATGLNPNTTYRIYVAASTKAGKGEPIFVDSVTSPSGYPDPPTFTIVDLNETFANITWQPSRSGVPGSVFYVQYKPRYHYDRRRSPDEYMAQHMTLRSLDPGTTYQVRVVAKNGDGYETASVWLEFLTPGVAPGYFDLNTSAWFYGIWISLFLILLGVILLMLLKKYTIQKWDEKDECYIVRPMDYDSVPSHGYP